jgi:tRNA nucleotidyltransferase (CCA-adding enzyme)
MEILKVGGAVRDSLLNINSSDNDYVVLNSSEEELISLGYQRVGASFPVFLHPVTKEEYALARTERKSGSGHTGFICDFSPSVTIKEDLLRRDLTINAIAIDVDGNIVDPFNGVGDLDNKILRHVSDAFSDDPLRVLRVARFMAKFSHLGFTVAPETIKLMMEIGKSGELHHLTPERVWKELSRSLLETTPSAFFLTLKDANCLEILFPEINQLFGVDQNKEHHPEIDTGIHTMMVIDRARELSDDIAVITAALLHDLGKGITPKDELPKHLNHETKGIPLVKIFCERFKLPSDVQHLSERVCENHLRCHRALEMRPGRILALIESLDGLRNPDRFYKFLLSCKADAQGRLGKKESPYPQLEFLMEALNTAKNVSPLKFIEKGMTGSTLGEAIRNERLIQITKFSNAIDYTNDNICGM